MAPADVNKEMVNKIKAEMTIMELLSTNTAVVTPSLCRLEAMRVSADELLQSGVCSVLYGTIYPLFSIDTEAGKIVRKLIKRYEDTLRAVGMVGEGPDITAVDNSSDTAAHSDFIRDVFTATSYEPIVEDPIVEAPSVEEPIAEENVATISFLRAARDKLENKSVSINEKESLVEKLRMMRVPLAGLEESPMIGKVVRRFYRKVAPPHSRAWNSAGKLYQDLRRQVLGNSVIVREMEEQGDMSVVPEVTADIPYEEDSWVEPTSVTTLLAREGLWPVPASPSPSPRPR